MTQNLDTYFVILISVAKSLQYTNNNLRFISLLCIRKTTNKLQSRNGLVVVVIYDAKWRNKT